MGIFNRLFGGRQQPVQNTTPRQEIAVGADNSSKEVTITFNDKNITFTGDLASYSYDTILRNKQENINRLYELSDYFVDADPIYRGIIKEVYTPFSIAEPYRLVGANEKVKQKYKEYYERIH